MVPFHDVFLTSNDMQLLQQMESGAVILEHPVSMQRLVALDFATTYKMDTPPNPNKFVITPDGCIYLEFLKERNRAQRKQRKQDQFRFWLPVIISIIALLVAILK